jgi:5'(3')-deoxyribonucleotidase
MKHSSLQPLHADGEPEGSNIPAPAVADGARKPMIAVDLDEVLGEFIPPLLLFHNETYGTGLTKGDFHSYRFSEVWGGTDQETQEKIMAFFSSSHFRDIPVIPKAREVLERLKDSFEFTVVTSRQHAIESQTRQWLNKHFPGIFSGVYFGQAQERG